MNNVFILLVLLTLPEQKIRKVRPHGSNINCGFILTKPFATNVFEAKDIKDHTHEKGGRWMDLIATQSKEENLALLIVVVDRFTI